MTEAITTVDFSSNDFFQLPRLLCWGTHEKMAPFPYSKL